MRKHKRRHHARFIALVHPNLPYTNYERPYRLRQVRIVYSNLFGG
jgi:hypothetical protein